MGIDGRRVGQGLDFCLLHMGALFDGFLHLAIQTAQTMNLKERQWVIGGSILLMSVIFIGRLFQLQLGPSAWKDYAARITEVR